LASIEIYIGETIGHLSEQAALQGVVRYLTAKNLSAVICANISLPGRQIDLVVALDRAVLVIEAKAYKAPIRGGMNGHWEVRLADGRWKQTSNSYLQAIAEKNALRDAMKAFQGTAPAYPDAVLLFVPSMPSESEISCDDSKVAIANLNQLGDLLGHLRVGSWSLDVWHRFAAHLRLKRVSSAETACSTELQDAAVRVQSHGDAMRRTYSPFVSEMLPVSCKIADTIVSSNLLFENAEPAPALLLSGASGCGKSLLTFKFALTALDRGFIPIVVAGKDFQGNLRDAANREATLLEAASAMALIDDASRLERRLLFVIDGYNECPPSERTRLTRSIAAAVKRYDANVVISSRIPLERPDLLPLYEWSVQEPSRDEKRAIAHKAASGAFAGQFEELLDTVTTGIEARMIGQLRGSLATAASRYKLFDAYVRHRLDADAQDGIRALSRVAGTMSDRITFSLTIQDFERLIDREKIGSEVSTQLFTKNLLERRGQRVSFNHEMFLNVFAAEAIVRRLDGDPAAIVAALRLPQNFEANTFIIGAIDDDTLRRQVLGEVTDWTIITACLAGQCGHDAQRWANDRCDQMLARIGKEIETVRFDISKDFYWDVKEQPDTIQSWTANDRAILAAIPRVLISAEI
jgi:hypothetical protein